ncbi:hypothetical protein ABID95_004722 [Streptomyces atratus]
MEVRQRHKHRMPDWSDKGATATTDDDPVTHSVWTVPVFGDDSDEPCYKSTGFADSSCNQAWRWNLGFAWSLMDNFKVGLRLREEVRPGPRRLRDAGPHRQVQRSPLRRHHPRGGDTEQQGRLTGTTRMSEPPPCRRGQRLRHVCGAASQARLSTEGSVPD